MPASMHHNGVRTIVFVAPFPADTTLRFAKAVSLLDRVRVVGVFQKPPADPARWGLSAV